LKRRKSPKNLKRTLSHPSPPPKKKRKSPRKVRE
jgi:hypothetical protein